MNKKHKMVRGTGRIVLYLYLVLILMSLFTVATYTWFSLSQTPEVNDMAVYINSPAGLELSADPLAEEWKLQINFADLMEDECILRPATWSDSDRRFYGIRYGLDGRMSQNLEPLEDERHANKDNLDGYYMYGSFFARSDENIDVYLSEAVEVQEGLQGAGTFVIGTAEWNEAEIFHEDGGAGAQYAIRLGFLVEKTDREGILKEDVPSSFIVFEPNCDEHIDGYEGPKDTESIDGIGLLVPEERLIRQTTSSWSEVYPVERNVVMYQLGEIEENKVLFSLEEDELAKITLYVWLEGQDADCTNAIGQECKILASVQFKAEPGKHSGLVPIE